ncbi:MAG: phosphatidate cytidylyltransferase [Candidatus Latescibacterota bacterium]
MTTLQNGSPPKLPSDSSVILRVIVSIVFVPCIYIITKKGGYHFLALINLMIFIGMVEFYNMMEWKGIKPYKGIGILCALALSWYVFFRNGVYANLLLTLVFIAIMCLELTRKNRVMTIFHISTTIFGVIYVSFLGSHMLLLREFPMELNIDYGAGSAFVFLAFLVTWSGDTGAYIVGKSIGKHPLLPRVSGKKTVEGAVGGAVFSLAGAIIARYTFAPFLATWHAIVIGLIGAGFGQLGDLVESMIKRDAQVKDASATLPGHGGVLDRFDSLLFTAPLIYYFLKFVVF